MAMKERRKFRRFETALDIKYTKVKDSVAIQSSGTTKNICLGGLCAVLSRIVKRKDVLLIELDSFRNKKIAFLAEVIWAEPTDDNRHNICGVKFLWVSSKPLLNDCLAYAREISAVV